MSIDEPELTAKSIPPPDRELTRIIRDLASKSKVFIGPHATEQMRHRDIDRLTINRVLDIGDIEGGIFPGDNEGEWGCKIVGPVRDNDREVGVALIVIPVNEKLFIKTVMWEDE